MREITGQCVPTHRSAIMMPIPGSLHRRMAPRAGYSWRHGDGHDPNRKWGKRSTPLRCPANLIYWRARRVIACASPSKLNVARTTGGAHFAVDYTKDGWQKEVLKITSGRGTDVVYNPVERIRDMLCFPRE